MRICDHNILLLESTQEK